MNWRYLATLGFFIAAFFFICARLFYWQIVRAEELSLMGQSQYGQSIHIYPQRGEIKTADMYPIATHKLSYGVFVNPKEVKEEEKNKVAMLLAPLLETESASVSAALDKELLWVSVGSVDKQKKDEIEKMDLDGVGFEEQSPRFYPEASMAAHLIGFVGKNDGGEDKGYFGLEGYYDRQLRGKPGIARQIHDALGRPIVAKTNKNQEKIDGRNLVLHVDRVVQFAAEKRLKRGIEQYGAAGGMVAVIDPKTGGILAMANVPSFDPRHFQEYDESLFKNPFISNMYEPGSTFKALVMAAAINEGAVKPDTHCPICAGPVPIGGYEIRTWNNEYLKNITMTEVIQHSDNTGMVYISQLLGLKKMLSYFDKFGIGSTTGIDLQGEVAPALREEDQWYPIDVATASFGQGISVTPIELLSGFASLANEGKRMEPHVVAKIETPDGQTIAIAPKVLSTPVTSKTAKVMTEILVNAVDKGEAKFAKPKGYRIAGKTGTAQIPIAGHYDPNKTIASFIGFAPADDPKFAMLVVIDRPTTSIYGAETAAPVFFNIARDLFNYYGIAPSE